MVMLYNTSMVAAHLDASSLGGVLSGSSPSAAALVLAFPAFGDFALLVAAFVFEPTAVKKGVTFTDKQVLWWKNWNSYRVWILPQR